MSLDEIGLSFGKSLVDCMWLLSLLCLFLLESERRDDEGNTYSGW